MHNRNFNIFRYPISIGLILAILLIISNGTANSIELRGKFNSDLYIWTDSSESHFRPYEQLRTDIIFSRPSRGKQISFHSNIRWRNDFQDQLPDDPQLFIYDGFLRIENMIGSSLIQLGRQYYYNGAGSAHFDGLRTQYKFGKKFKVNFFGGSRVNRLDPETIKSFSESGIMGSKLQISGIRRTNLNFSWLAKLEEDNIVYNKATIDIKKRSRFWVFYGKAGFNILNKRLSDILSRAIFTNNEWRISAEYSKREPSLFGNTIFSIIDYKKNKTLRLNLNRHINSRLSIFSRYQVSFFSAENSRLYNFGFSFKNITLSYYKQTGYGGKNSGFSGSAYHSLNSNWQTYARFNLSKYKIQSLQSDNYKAYTAAFGMDRKFTGGWVVRGEYQYLKNAISNNDVRLYFRVSKNFVLGKI